MFYFDNWDFSFIVDLSQTILIWVTIWVILLSLVIISDIIWVTIVIIIATAAVLN